MNIPPLPKIEGDVDIILDIYSHRSLKTNYMNDEYGDTDRLVELGGRVLDMTLASHLFHKRPILLAEQISDYAREAVSDDKLREWLTFYNIKSKFRAAPGSCEILESPDEMRRFFKAYIGALYIRNGVNHVQHWISALVDPDANTNAFSNPPPPLGMPPPLPQHLPNNSPSSSGASTITLALMNQTAAQKGLSVTYPAEPPTGPSHNPTWKVSCCINSIPKGYGSGKSQKAAKEEAARQAYQAMGW
ncbi:hypothetical protein B0H13DRAFT_1973890 [Mycena leptocephala]|nr:hypothetical protein B0H13DRAFT_1973890 [Mycena leptocephala]